MTEESGRKAQAKTQPRDAAYWAQVVDRLKVGQLPPEAVNLIQGKQVAGALQGFGQMWQKTYRIRLAGAEATPQEVIREWKANFPSFWPQGSRFFTPLTGIAPGEVALLSVPILPGPVPLSTGVMVMYADEESFSFMNPQGHMFAGWITFSAYEDGPDTWAQVQALVRPGDPLFEIAARLVGYKQEDAFWRHTLKSLARHLGVEGDFSMKAVLIDPRWQWRYIGNVRHNAMIHSVLHFLTAPLRWLRRAART